VTTLTTTDALLRVMNDTARGLRGKGARFGRELTVALRQAATPTPRGRHARHVPMWRRLLRWHRAPVAVTTTTVVAVTTIPGALIMSGVLFLLVLGGCAVAPQAPATPPVVPLHVHSGLPR
jgi:hypothetical protein